MKLRNDLAPYVRRGSIFKAVTKDPVIVLKGTHVAARNSTAIRVDRTLLEACIALLTLPAIADRIEYRTAGETYNADLSGRLVQGNRPERAVRE